MTDESRNARLARTTFQWQPSLWCLLVLLVVTGCADHVTCRQADVHAAVGFWFGLWHGSLLPFSWIISLFDDSVAIYAVYNNGGWYDFGFVLGIGAFTSGTSRASS